MIKSVKTMKNKLKIYENHYENNNSIVKRHVKFDLSSIKPNFKQIRNT